MEKSAIGLIGLGVMGSSLSRNIANNKFKISVYNRTKEVTDKFIEEHGNKFIEGAGTLEEFVEQLESPRKIIIMVKAGAPADAVIGQLKPLLKEGDVVVDCGNENYHNTQRRFEDLGKDGIHFVGCGVSGGEEGALNGPSMMPGGTIEAWEGLKNIFEKISARDFDGGSCVTYIGDNGAGHYVKMVHNGIEYAIMQMMAEAYDLLKNIYNLEAAQLSEIFKKFNSGKLQSYLFEISIPVLSKEEDGKYIVDLILDKAAQKGTGKWTAIDALERGVAVPTITEAVFARFLSNKKEFRKQLSDKYKKDEFTSEMDLDKFVEVLEDALFAGMLSAYAQGFELIKKAADEEEWKVDFGEIARIWEGGCIIRANILNVIHRSFEKAGKDLHLFEVPQLAAELTKTIPKLKEVIDIASKTSLPVSGLYTALSYFISLTREQLPANFIQGLRDYFGAHTYERIDKEGTFHTEWED